MYSILVSCIQFEVQYMYTTSRLYMLNFTIIKLQII